MALMRAATVPYTRRRRKSAASTGADRFAAFDQFLEAPQIPPQPFFDLLAILPAALGVIAHLQGHLGPAATGILKAGHTGTVGTFERPPGHPPVRDAQCELARGMKELAVV